MPSGYGVISERVRGDALRRAHRMMAATKSFRMLFSIAPVLPQQFFAVVYGRAISRSGEYRLLVAVLEDAVTCYQRYAQPRTKRERVLFSEAAEWIMNSDLQDRRVEVSTYPAFSFEQICAALDLDADYIRAGLRRWRSNIP